MSLLLTMGLERHWSDDEASIVDPAGNGDAVMCPLALLVVQMGAQVNRAGVAYEPNWLTVMLLCSRN